MKNFFLFLLISSTVIIFSSCFEITEEVTINKKGDGHYVSKTDASKFAEQMAMFAAFDTTGEMVPKMKYSIDSTFASQFKKFANVKGVSNVKVDTSKEYVYTISMDFKDIETLNTVMSLDKPDDQKNLYTWSKGKLTRKDAPYSMSKDMNVDDPSQKEMMQGFMKDMKYTLIYNLPNKVKSCSNKSAKVSDDKKTVTIESNMNDLMEGTTKLGSEIKF